MSKAFPTADVRLKKCPFILSRRILTKLPNVLVHQNIVDFLNQGLLFPLCITESLPQVSISFLGMQQNRIDATIRGLDYRFNLEIPCYSNILVAFDLDISSELLLFKQATKVGIVDAITSATTKFYFNQERFFPFSSIVILSWKRAHCIDKQPPKLSVAVNQVVEADRVCSLHAALNRAGFGLERTSGY